jgi:hypothetical protein
MDCALRQFVNTECTIIPLDSDLRKLLLDEYSRHLRYILELRVRLKHPVCTGTSRLTLRTLCPVHKDEFNNHFDGKDFINTPLPLSAPFLFEEVQKAFAGSYEIFQSASEMRNPEVNTVEDKSLPVELRVGQAEVIHSMLLQKTVLCILPTAYGKTLASVSSSFIKAQV